MLKSELRDEFVRVVARNAPGIAGTLGLVLSGTLAMIHDAKDIGKFDRIHHWLLGLIAIILGVVLLFFQLLFMSDELGEVRVREFK